MDKQKQSHWSATAKTDLVLSILAGELTIEQAALQNDLDPQKVIGWRDLYIAAGRRHNVQTRGFARNGVRVALSAAALAVLLLVGGKVVAAYYPGCVDDQAGFLCFGANTPAKASEVNGNFAKIVDWIEAKVGPVEESNVTFVGNTEFDGTIGTSGAAITVAAGKGITGVDHIEGDSSGLVIRGDGDSDDISIAANGTVTIPTLAVTNGLPITLSSEVEVIVDLTNPPAIPTSLGVSDVNSVCFITSQFASYADPALTFLHSCRVLTMMDTWHLEVANPLFMIHTVKCSARCISW